MEPPEKKFALAVIENGKNEILLLLRAASAAIAPGKWGLPGGTLKTGESPQRAVARELEEEIGKLKIRLIQSLPPVRDTLYGGKFEIHLFHYRFDGGKIKLSGEHDQSAWVNRDEYRHYRVADGVDEDLAYLKIWPRSFLNRDKLPPGL